MSGIAEAPQLTTFGPLDALRSHFPLAACQPGHPVQPACSFATHRRFARLCSSQGLDALWMAVSLFSPNVATREIEGSATHRRLWFSFHRRLVPKRRGRCPKIRL